MNRPGQLPQVTKKNPLREASDLYEKQFLRTMVKSMRKTIHSGGLIKRNMAEKIFQEQMDHEYVEKWSERGEVGLSDLIYDQIVDRFSTKYKFPKRGMYPVDGGKLNKADSVENGLRFQIQPKPESKVKSPLSGVIEGAVKSGDSNWVRIRHAQGLKSHLIFSGEMTRLSVGQELSQGQDIGQLPVGTTGQTAETKPLYWHFFGSRQTV